MDVTMESCRSFVALLGSTAPAPGGGGAAALVGAIGTALGNMAASLAIGKKKYAPVEEELKELSARCSALQNELLDQVEADEVGFLPLAAAYKIPKGTPNREQDLNAAKIAACQAPLRILELSCEALDCIAVIAQKGSRLAVSDAGSAAVCCRAAIQAASLAIFSNTKTLTDRTAAEEIEGRVEQLLDTYCPLADRVFQYVCSTYGR